MKNRALVYTIGFALVGIIMTLLVTYVQRKTLQTTKHNVPYITLGDNVKNQITTTSLLIEQYVGGNNSLNFEKDVLPKYSTSQVILQGAYDGKATILGEFEKSNDEETQANLKETIIDLERLSEAAKNKWNARQVQAISTDSSSIDTPPNSIEEDQKYSAAHQKFQATLTRLVDHVNNEIKSDANFLNTISWLSILVLGSSFILLSVVLYRHQHGNDKMKVEIDMRLAIQEGVTEKLSGFIDAVSAGNYAVNLELEGNESNLTNKLITMRDKLKENTESEYKRSWTNVGLAQIGEILRVTTANASELYDDIIQFIVKYTKSSQGGLFIINQNDENENKIFLELVSCYAFERKKFLNKNVEPGEGLVGQCFLEGERIYLAEVPKDYISINSGLGGSKPKALLIVPMKLNGKVYGVIELATFTKYQDFEIELMEKLAENVASTISTVKINQSTSILLAKTQQQAEEMRAQEEEIHQSMEELEATQEEMRRKQMMVENELIQSQEQTKALKLQETKLIESQNTLQAIVDNIPRAIFWKDKDLRFMGCNRIFSDTAGLASPRDIVGKTDFDMPWSEQADAYRKDDLEIIKSRVAKLNIEEVNVNSNEEQSWVMTSKVPIVNLSDDVVAILGMFEDITERRLKEADIVQKLKERDDALAEIEELKRRLQAKG